MNNYIDVNDFIKKYDNQNDDLNYNNSEDIYYNDFITNYEEV